MKALFSLIFILFLSCGNDNSNRGYSSDNNSQDSEQYQEDEQMQGEDTYYEENNNNEYYQDKEVSEEEEYDGEYFLICTDPEEAYSHHMDYSDESEYCQGLINCVRRGFKVERLQEDEALDLRADPCDYCFGH